MTTIIYKNCEKVKSIECYGPNLKLLCETKKPQLTLRFFRFVALFRADCSYRASGCARTAIDAFFVDAVLSISFSNSFYWAYRSTSSAFDTFAADFIHSSFSPPPD